MRCEAITDENTKDVGTEANSPLTRATRGWLDHLRVERGAADNTLTSYRRDLARYGQFLSGRGISDPAVVRESDVTEFLASLREGAPERPPLSASCRRDLARYGQFLSGRGISDPAVVRESDVTEFLASLREGAPERPPLSASSAARTLIAVRGFHRFMALEGVTQTDPAEGVAPPKVPKRLPKAISIKDVENLLSAASLGDGLAALRDRAMLEVLYGAGARISEAVGLDLDDIDRGDIDHADTY